MRYARSVALIVLAAILAFAASAARQGPAWVPLAVIIACVALSAVPSTLARAVAASVLALVTFQIAEAPQVMARAPFDPPSAIVLGVAALAVAVCAGVLTDRPHTIVAIGAAVFFLHPFRDTYAFTYSPLPAVQAMVLVAMLVALVAWRALPSRFGRAAVALTEPFVVLLAGWLLAVVFLKEREYALRWLWTSFVLTIAVPATVPAALRLLFATVAGSITPPRSDPPPPPR